MTNKKQVKKNKKADYENLEQFDGMLKTLGAVLGIFLLFYVITVFVTGGFSRPGLVYERDTTARIQYTEILAGETFNKPGDSYYVMFYDSEDPVVNVLDVVIERYRFENPDETIYIVDLNKGFNKPYVSEDSNADAQNSADLRIAGPTLMKIEKGSNVLYVEGEEEIREVLK